MACYCPGQACDQKLLDLRGWLTPIDFRFSTEGTFISWYRGGCLTLIGGGSVFLPAFSASFPFTVLHDTSDVRHDVTINGRDK